MKITPKKKNKKTPTKLSESKIKDELKKKGIIVKGNKKNLIENIYLLTLQDNIKIKRE